MHKRKIERRELLIAKLIAHINNKATEMLNKFKLIKAYPSDGFICKQLEPIGIKLGVVQMHGTSSRHGLNQF